MSKAIPTATYPAPDFADNPRYVSVYLPVRGNWRGVYAAPWPEVARSLRAGKQAHEAGGATYYADRWCNCRVAIDVEDIPRLTMGDMMTPEAFLAWAADKETT